jgi:hypothetical protein
MRGARIGVNARGHGYRAAGRGGRRYRSTLGRERQSATKAPRSSWPLLLALAVVLIAALGAYHC